MIKVPGLISKFDGVEEKGTLLTQYDGVATGSYVDGKIAAAVGAEAEARETAIADVVSAEAEARAAAIAEARSDVDGHKADTANPHVVTAAQVGLGNVDNTSDTAKPVSTAQAAAIADAVSTEAEARAEADSELQEAQEFLSSRIDIHEAAFDNPHVVTASQVGLGNVDNTADADKPVSTAQAAYVDNAILALGGGTGQIEDALPPLFADREGYIVAARGGTLIELNSAG